MARIRKEPNRYWSKEDKLKLINEVLDGKSFHEVTRNNDILGGMLRNWIIKYNKYGIESLDNKKKSCNPLCKYSNKKNLTDIEKLQYENMKLRIENERLKKIPNERKWFSCSVQEIKQKEFEIVQILSEEYSIKSLCEIMNISRSGYYK